MSPNDNSGLWVPVIDISMEAYHIQQVSRSRHKQWEAVNLWERQVYGKSVPFSLIFV